MSLSSLVAGSVSLSKSLWESFGRRSVFGDDADELVQARPPGRRQDGTPHRSPRPSPSRRRCSSSASIPRATRSSRTPRCGAPEHGAALHRLTQRGFQVVRAAEFAAAAHAGQVRRTGEAYVTHAVETARIMAGLVPSSSPRSVSAVAAALLHDVVDDTSTTVEDVATAFGAEIASLVDGVTRLSQLNQLLRRHRRLEMVEGAWATAGPQPSDATPGSLSGGLAPNDGATLRALILSMVDDPRVVLLKLADRCESCRTLRRQGATLDSRACCWCRLHNMRTLHALPPEKARAVAAETLGVWCSLAARLGVWTIKAELEDLCFAVLMPGTFLRLKATLDTIWSGRAAAAAQTARSDEELMAELLASVPPQADEGLTPEQLRTRALLSCVLPFDLLTPRQWDSGARASTVVTGAPASAAAALEALMACQKALRDELRLSAVAPGLEVTVQGRLKSLWSTHMKMQRKECGAREVYDARALRVVVEDTSTQDVGVETEACYSLLSAVHKLWKPVGGEYDNYIANPVRPLARMRQERMSLTIRSRLLALHRSAAVTSRFTPLCAHQTALRWRCRCARVPCTRMQSMVPPLIGCTRTLRLRRARLPRRPAAAVHCSPTSWQLQLLSWSRSSRRSQPQTAVLLLERPPSLLLQPLVVRERFVGSLMQ